MKSELTIFTEPDTESVDDNSASSPTAPNSGLRFGVSSTSIASVDGDSGGLCGKSSTSSISSVNCKSLFPVSGVGSSATGVSGVGSTSSTAGSGCCSAELLSSVSGAGSSATGISGVGSTSSTAGSGCCSAELLSFSGAGSSATGSASCATTLFVGGVAPLPWVTVTSKFLAEASFSKKLLVLSEPKTVISPDMLLKLASGRPNSARTISRV